MKAAETRQKTLHKSSLDNHRRVRNDLAMTRIVLQITLRNEDRGWWPVQWVEVAAKMEEAL